ncbi:hypothetical protein OROHE_022180 [Orobanche hederae]
MLQEVHHTIREETRKLQRIVSDHIKVCEHWVQLEKKKQLDSWSKELKKREALIETERQKLEETRMKSDLRKSVLQLAFEEQKVFELFFLTYNTQREKEAALEKVLELERSSECEKRNLELEIKLLRAKLEVTILVGNGVNDDDASIQQKIDGMSTVRQEAFKKLVAGLCNLRVSCVSTNDAKVSKNACDEIGNARWLLNKNDELLRGIEYEWGYEVYDAVTTALIVLQNYNPNGSYIVPQLWSFMENRKATEREVIAYIIVQFKTFKRGET